MKSLIKLSILTFCLTLLNCKNEEKSFNDFKFVTDESLLTCNDLDTKLYEEAMLSFENDINNTYQIKNSNHRRAYSLFTKDAMANTVNYKELVSPHTMAVFEALKKDKNLWNQDNSLNYKAPIFNCLANNFKNKDLQTTFKALVSTNSMRSDIFRTPLLNHVKNSIADRYMATYVALDFFYVNLFNVDPTTLTEKTEPKAAE